MRLKDGRMYTICTKGKQMLVFHGKLSTLMNISGKIVGGRQTAQKVRDHQRMLYYLDSNQLCRSTFKFIHVISTNRLTTHLLWYRNNRFGAKDKQAGGRHFNMRAHSFAGIKNCIIHPLHMMLCLHG